MLQTKKKGEKPMSPVIILSLSAAIGCGCGVALGAAFHNIPAGMLIGTTAGLIIGVIICAIKKAF